MIYDIRNKDRVIGKFDWTDEDMPTPIDDSKLPAFIKNGLLSWLSSRAIPKNRAYMNKLFTAYNLKSIKEVIDHTMGLSLSDTLWVVHESCETDWEYASLYRNEFDKVAARLVFDGLRIPDETFGGLSPEFSTHGESPKCWDHLHGIPVLIKGGKMTPFIEVMAHQILTALDYDHVPYSVCEYFGKPASMCRVFTDECTSFIPLWCQVPSPTFEGVVAECRRLGLEKGLARVLVADYLIGNQGRQIYDWGTLVDSDTFDVHGFAPIFGNRKSLLYNWNGSDDYEKYNASITPALYPTFEHGAKLGKQILGDKHGVENLVGFKFDQDELPGLSEEIIFKTEIWLQNRVLDFLRM